LKLPVTSRSYARGSRVVVLALAPSRGEAERHFLGVGTQSEHLPHDVGVPVPRATEKIPPAGAEARAQDRPLRRAEIDGQIDDRNGEDDLGRR